MRDPTAGRSGVGESPDARVERTPVVTADLPPIREFARGVVPVDPRDADGIAAGLNEALAHGDELGREGREAAAAYDWDRVAAETIEVYREVTG